MERLRHSRPAAIMLVIALTIVVALVRTTPAAASSWSETKSMTYSTDYSFASEVDLCPYGPPCELRLVAESDLNSGYVGSQICLNGGGQVMYNTYLTSWGAILAQFDPYNDWSVYEAPIPSGDYQYAVTLNPIQVNDEDADGNPGPKIDYTVSFGSIIRGRQISISYQYGLAYPKSNCQSDGYSTQVTVQS
jgi:hypothetical protein